MATTLARCSPAAPTFKFDGPLLEDFLALRPPAFHFAFEVRHASWYTEETYAVLRQNETALCLSETDKQTPQRCSRPALPTPACALKITPEASRGLEETLRRLAWQGRGCVRLFQARRRWQSTAYARQLVGKTN